MALRSLGDLEVGACRCIKAEHKVSSSRIGSGIGRLCIRYIQNISLTAAACPEGALPYPVAASFREEATYLKSK